MRVLPRVRMINEHPVFRVEDFPDEELEPLLGEPAHVQPGLADERHLQLLLQVSLLLRDLLQRVQHQVVPE